MQDAAGRAGEVRGGAGVREYGGGMTAARDTMADRLGRYLARKLTEPAPGSKPFTHANVAALRRVLQPGDVLLVEGNSRVSVAIKYLTQSTWSHAALYVGNALGQVTPDGEPLSLIEVNLGEGCIAAPLVEVRALQHPDLPGERADAAGPGAAGRLHGRRASASATT